MTSGLSPFVRQVAALSLLLLIVVAAFSLGNKIFVAPIQSRSADIAALSARLTELDFHQNDERFVAKQKHEADKKLRSLNIFWSGPTRPQIAAAMQDVLRMAAQQSGGQVVSASVLQEASQDMTIAVRARIDGTLTTVQHVLSVLEQSRPRLFVNSIVVTTLSAENTQSGPQQLSLEVGIVGYVAANDHQTP